MNKFWLVRRGPFNDWKYCSYNPVQTESERELYRIWDVMECTGELITYKPPVVTTVKLEQSIKNPD